MKCNFTKKELRFILFTVTDIDYFATISENKIIESIIKKIHKLI